MPVVSATVEQMWREKMSEKPDSIRLLRQFNFSQSGSRKNNRKAFEGASMEPTILSATIEVKSGPTYVKQSLVVPLIPSKR